MMSTYAKPKRVRITDTLGIEPMRVVEARRISELANGTVLITPRGERIMLPAWDFRTRGPRYELREADGDAPPAQQSQQPKQHDPNASLDARVNSYIDDLLDGNMTTGVSIIELDSEMDHGPILIQSAFIINPSATAGTIEVECGQLGGELLVQVLPHYLDGTLIPKEQDHTRATICKKITKDLGEITLQTNASEVQRKFRALTPWPSLYFFIEHKERRIRIKVTSVDLVLTESETLVAADIILKVIPEGKSEMSFEDFKRGYLA
jgi:hypothetical protein